MIRHRPPRSRSSSYDSVSPRRHSRSTSRSRGKKKKSHKKRKQSSTSSFSSRRSFSSSSSERERKRHKSKKKKKKHSKSLSSKRDKSKKKHKRKRSPSPPPSSSSFSVSSESSSSPQRSPARKRSRIISRSPSPADVNPHSAARAASPASHQDSLSLYADNSDEFNNSQSRMVRTWLLIIQIMFPSLKAKDLRNTCNLLALWKKFLNFSRPICFPGKLKSCWEETGQDLQLNWRSGRLPERTLLCHSQGDP